MSDSAAIRYIHANRGRLLDELKEFIRIPSVSTLPEHKEDLARAARWLGSDLERIGMEHVEVVPTRVHPLVYADWLHAPVKPTVLCYGHYDVQPAETADGWSHPPFDPVERDGTLYGRGVADDKGQMFAHFKAAEALMRTAGALPVNVRFLIEGEEEVGGDTAECFVRANAERLSCDVVLVSDTALHAPDVPTLTVGLRGMVYAEVEARGSTKDLHSGFGGACPSALVSLCQMIARLKDEDGHILIPGFYDRVKPPSQAELNSWNDLRFDEEVFRTRDLGSSVLAGEPGYSALHRIWARPSLDVHGIAGGFTGPGGKTVIPARASAKISMRLVPDQDPKEIYELFERYVRSIAPKGIQLGFSVFSLADPIVVDTGNRFVEAAADALAEVYGRETAFIRCGGSLPIVAAFERSLGVPILLMGFCLPDCGAHGPDEKMSVKDYFRGIESVTRLFELLGD